MLEEGVATRRRRSLATWVRKLAWLAVPLALLGEAGHHLLGRLGQTLAHHFFHIVFGLGAVVVFAVYVFVDVRRNGWPSFSWRIRPEEAGPAD
jgi:hypothetical protein